MHSLDRTLDCRTGARALTTSKSCALLSYTVLAILCCTFNLLKDNPMILALGSRHYDAPNIYFPQKEDVVQKRVHAQKTSVSAKTFMCMFFFDAKKAVLRIHDILGWIRIRIRGSMPLTDGSGFGSGFRSGSWIRILLFSSVTFKMPAKN